MNDVFLYLQQYSTTKVAGLLNVHGGSVITILLLSKSLLYHLNKLVFMLAHTFYITGVAANDREEFKEELRYNWFETYSRSGGPLDSSGFEHVFVGEIRVSLPFSNFNSF